MTDHPSIPEGVDPASADLLRRAYELHDTDEGQQLYREWAETYDATMVEGLGYLSPRLLVELFAQHATPGDGAILDLGCGTGLVAVELARHGFTLVDGLDLSESMMAVAARTGLYRNLLEGDLTTHLEIDTDAYAAAVCNGTFTSGHVDASCLDEIVRIIAPGGLFACAVHHSVWDALGFADGFARLEASGALMPVEIKESQYYETSHNDGRLCVFRVERA